jgi:SagB-type dehydrogenase family enzyme
MRMFPSAGALQPVEAYILSRNIDDLEHGIYHYEADKHLLTLIRSGDFSHELYRFSLEQDHVREAAFNIILTMVYPRTASKYGYRSYRYALLDIGHVGMNIYLVATAMNLGTCAVGAFEDDKVGSLLQLDGRNEFPILIYPIGVPR